MRLISLTIKNVRGIPDLHIQLDAKNVAIWGPNGSGKSGVVDAIDFLFTGRISRLTGEGTRGISLDQHGPHIDHAPRSAVVTATVQLNGITDPVEISRCMAQPKRLRCSSEARPLLDDITKFMQRGGVVLTRRDILRYVNAEAGKRSDEIQELLNLKRVEVIRKSLTSVRNNLRKQIQSAKSKVENAAADVNVIVGASNYSDASLIEMLNKCRKTLSGEPLEELLTTGFKDGLLPPAVIEESSAHSNPAFYLQAIQNIKRNVKPDLISEYKSSDAELRNCLTTLKNDPVLQSELELLELSRFAARFVEHSTVKCPVCDASWPEGYLNDHLERKIGIAQSAKKLSNSITKGRDGLSSPAQNLHANVVHLEENLREANLGTSEEDLQVLASWREDLAFFMEALKDPTETYLDCGLSVNDVVNIFVPPGLGGLLDRIETTTQAELPNLSKVQTAWDKLTRLEERVRVLKKLRHQMQFVEINYNRSAILLTAYEKSRVSVLDGLYSRISNRFEEFYRFLHDNERNNFSAQLQLEGAALDFGVDFLGRGIHPPQALHSEGHQDSMGVCLFLALNEELAKKKVELIVLDDVVMSIDTDHRRDLCRMLRKFFPCRQFVITTHDGTWVRQLKLEGVVEKSRVTEFTNWTLEDGPIAHLMNDLWENIQEDLEKENVPRAAFHLRRGSEEFLENVCDALGAKLIYNSNRRWDFGDWLDAAKSEYKKLLKEAKSSASSWSKQTEVSKFVRLDSLRSKIFAQIPNEQWAINENVHYNTLANMSKQEFVAVVEVFKELYDLFQCQECGGLLEKFPRKGKPEVVKCRCGVSNWNLSHKPKAG